MLRPALLVALSALVPAAAAAKDPPKRYALLVGVNTYEHPKLPALKYAVNDVTELAAVLRGTYEITLLTDDTEAKPTKANVDAAVAKLTEKCGKGDTLVVALAGHGVQFQGQPNAFFCPADAKPFPDEVRTLVSLGDVYSGLDKSFAGVKVLLVDACRDDPTAPRGASRGIDGDTAPRPPHGVAALFSCRAGERAFEHDDLKHGVFFHHVIQGMQAQARNQRGEVTFNSLTDYVATEVAGYVPRVIGGGAKQSPNQKADLSGASPVLLVGVAPAAPGVPVALNPERRAKDALEEGIKHFYGRGVKADMVKATEFFRLAADDGNPDAMYNLTIAYLFGYGVPTDFGLARKWALAAHEKGNPVAMTEVAYMHLLGHGVAPDEQVARDLYTDAFPKLKRAADTGDIAALNRLGFMHRDGLGVPQDGEKAVAMFRRAAEAGHPLAKANLGDMYARGLGGLDKDPKTASKWFTEAADAGEPWAMMMLADLYLAGDGVPRNTDEAVRLLRKATALKYPSGMFRLAELYMNGEGVPRDDAEAFRLLVRTAEANVPDAMNVVGVWLWNGERVGRDVAGAERWWRKAAAMGHEQAKKNLRDTRLDP